MPRPNAYGLAGQKYTSNGSCSLDALGSFGSDYAAFANITDFVTNMNEKIYDGARAVNIADGTIYKFYNFGSYAVPSWKYYVLRDPLISVKAVSTANISDLSNVSASTHFGDSTLTFALGDVFLVNNQTVESANGIYVCSQTTPQVVLRNHPEYPLDIDVSNQVSIYVDSDSSNESLRKHILRPFPGASRTTPKWYKDDFVNNGILQNSSEADPTLSVGANMFIAGDVSIEAITRDGTPHSGDLSVAGALSVTGKINKVTVTAPANGSTLTIADGRTLTVSNTLTFTGNNGSSIAFGGGGTVAYATGNLSQFASTTSAELASVISDETGTGALVFSDSPELVTPSVTSTGLKLKGTSSGVSTLVSGNTGTSNYTLTLPLVTDTLVGKTTTDTLTNKTLSSEKYNITTNISAAGSTYADATAISSDYCVVSTVGSGQGVILPAFGVSLGRKIIVVNKGDNTLKIYPSVSGTIDGGSANDAITLGINKKVELICTSISGGIALWHSDLVNQLPSSGIVTSVGLTVGTSGSDVAVSGSPITSSGTITLNIPDAGISKRGVVNAGAQTFLGPKTFEAFFRCKNIHASTAGTGQQIDFSLGNVFTWNVSSDITIGITQTESELESYVGGTFIVVVRNTSLIQNINVTFDDDNQLFAFQTDADGETIELEEGEALALTGIILPINSTSTSFRVYGTIAPAWQNLMS